MDKQTFENLLERYWNLAYDEGKNGVSHGDEANEVLFELRRIHVENEVLMNALWKACGDDEEVVNATIESQR